MKLVRSISGKWNASIYATWLFDWEHPKGTTVCLWTKDPTQIGVHKVTPYCLKLNELSVDYERLLPPTDSRLRPDRRYLQHNQNERAAALKLIIEDRQRTQFAERKQHNEQWIPRWFQPIRDEYLEGTMWKYKGDYWDQRSQKITLLDDDPQRAQQLLVRENFEGTACDFRAYQTNHHSTFS